MKTLRAAAVVLLVLALLGALALWRLNVRDEEGTAGNAPAAAPTPALIERGAYLARAGNCAGCHTRRGGAAYAGGVAIETPFGAVLSSNLTPDATHGIGRWSPAQFWRALHNGRSADGRLLYPAFPYPNTTLATRADADALYAFLRSLPPAAEPNQPHRLRFPYNTQLALAVWRALFFAPGVYEPETQRSAAWNRGAYLARGLAHCNACHGQRNAWGGSSGDDFSGSLIPVQNWYAPSLTAPAEAGVHDWPLAQVVALLKTGVVPRGAVLGPMAEVVAGSTQHLSDGDLSAIAEFLQSLPRTPSPVMTTAAPAPAALLTRGAQIYDQHCAACHGAHGEGAPGAYPALAGNRAVTMAEAANVLHIVVAGGYPPSTAGNPRPYGMPPFGHVLDSAEIAAVVSHIRGAWGNGAAPVSPLQVLKYR